MPPLVEPSPARARSPKRFLPTQHFLPDLWLPDFRNPRLPALPPAPKCCKAKYTITNRPRKGKPCGSEVDQLRRIREAERVRAEGAAAQAERAAQALRAQAAAVPGEWV